MKMMKVPLKLNSSFHTHSVHLHLHSKACQLIYKAQLNDFLGRLSKSDRHHRFSNELWTELYKSKSTGSKGIQFYKINVQNVTRHIYLIKVNGRCR